MKSFIRKLLAVFTGLLCAVPANAAHTYAQEGNWSLFRDGYGNNKACWIATQKPTNSGAKMLLMISKIGNSPIDVSFRALSAYPHDTPMYLNIPEVGKFEFFRDGRSTWPKSRNDVPKILKGLSIAENASQPISFSFGSRPPLVIDITGFTKAGEQLEKTCIK